MYDAGGNGAEFVRQNVQALVNSTDIDHEGAGLFRVPGSSTRVDAIANAAQQQSQS